MIKKNYLKLFALAAFVLFLNTTVNAQDNSSRMEREKAKQRVSQSKEVNGKTADKEEVTWLYNTVHVSTKNNRIAVEFQESKMKPKTRAQEVAMKMQYQKAEEFKKATDTFEAEADVLNYLSRQGMELVSVVPDGKEGNAKMYYLRTKVTE